MHFKDEKSSPSPIFKKKKAASGWSHAFLKNTKNFKHVFFSSHQPKVSPKRKSFIYDFSPENSTIEQKSPKIPETPPRISPKSDLTVLLEDEILMKILSRVPNSQFQTVSLVCKRWRNLHGRLVRSVKITNWEYLLSRKITNRFPNLTQIDIVSACCNSASDSSVSISNKFASMKLDSNFWANERLRPSEAIDEELKELASNFPNLRKLSVLNATELGLLSVAEECPILQDLELQNCSDNVLRGIAACGNLQILKLVANSNGIFSSNLSDIGLTILAQGCKRLVRLELSGCEGGFEGIKAIGQCCQMLVELTISDQKMELGWLAGLAFCDNLKTLKLVSCKAIDSCESEEYSGACPVLERLSLRRCQLREKTSAKCLFRVCESVREIGIEDCWGMSDEVLGLARVCKDTRAVTLKGCSLVTCAGLEDVLLSWRKVRCVCVESCKSVKGNEVSPALSALISDLKELRWSPDGKRVLASGLAGTGVGKKGGKFFTKS